MAAAEENETDYLSGLGVWSWSVTGLVERGLMRLDTTQGWPRLFFTETGLAALRLMMANARLANPVKFAPVRQELGIDQIPKTDVPQA